MTDGLIRHQAPVSNVALGCSVQTGAGDLATRDAAAVERNYRTYQELGPLNSPPIIPRTVGHNGAIDPVHAGQVSSMLDCMGQAYNVNPGVMRELQGMYSDSVRLERASHSMGMHGHR